MPRMCACVNIRRHANGQLTVATTVVLALLCADTAAAQTVIANSQLQTCIASGSVHSPTRAITRGCSCCFPSKPFVHLKLSLRSFKQLHTLHRPF